MRIAVITNDGPQGGGAGHVAEIYTQTLIRDGHEVRTWGPSELFTVLSRMSAIRRLFFHLRDLGAHSATVSQIVAWQPDVLLTHNLTGCGFATSKHIHRHGIRWVHLLHDVQLIEPSGQIIKGESFSVLHWLWRSIWSALRHVVMGEPDEVISPTKWLLEFHRSFGWFRGKKTMIIPNPIQIHQTVVELPRDPKELIFVGRVDWDKGIDLLIEAWPRVRDSVSRLVVIGDGAWLSRIRGIKDPKIEVCGRLSSDEVGLRLQHAGILVVPSRVQENQPTVILEGLAAGCWIIATNVGGVKETLDGEGEVVEANSVDALVASMKRALGSDMHSTNSAHVLATHDPDVCVAALIGVLKSNL